MARKRFPVVCSLFAFVTTAVVTFADEGRLEEFYGYKFGSFATEKEIEQLEKFNPLRRPIGGFTEVALKYSDDYQLYAVMLRAPANSHEKVIRCLDQVIARYDQYIERIVKDGQATSFLKSKNRGSLQAVDFRPHDNTLEVCDTQYYRQPYHPLPWAYSDEQGFAVYRHRSYVVPPWLQEKKTTPITHIFGIQLGATLDEIDLPYVKLNDLFAGCQYGFTPKIKFRQFDTYCFKIEDGKVSEIIAAWPMPRNKSWEVRRKGEYVGAAVESERLAVRGILQEKYKIQSLKRTHFLHAGTGDDYTLLQELECDKKIPPKKKSGRGKSQRYFAISLGKDVGRVSAERMAQERAKRKQEEDAKARKIQLDGIDAL